MREHRTLPERRQVVLGCHDHRQALPPTDVPQQEGAFGRMTPLWARANGSSLQQTPLPGLRGQPNVVQEPGYTQLNLRLVR